MSKVKDRNLLEDIDHQLLEMAEPQSKVLFSIKKSSAYAQFHEWMETP